MVPRTNCASRTPTATTRSPRRSGTKPIPVSRRSTSRATRASAKACIGASCTRPRSAPGCAICEEPMQLSDVDFRDIQGLVRFGYGHLRKARFYLLQITDAAQASAWIKDHIDDLTPPVTDRQAPRALQIAFTYKGLGKLGIAPSVLNQFSLEFRGGMADPNRSRRLGDVDANHPACWDWGAPGKNSRKARNETGTQRVPGDCKDNRDNRCPDVLVLMYGTEGAFKHWDTQIRCSWADAFREIYAL